MSNSKRSRLPQERSLFFLFFFFIFIWDKRHFAKLIYTTGIFLWHTDLSTGDEFQHSQKNSRDLIYWDIFEDNSCQLIFALKDFKSMHVFLNKPQRLTVAFERTVFKCSSYWSHKLVKPDLPKALSHIRTQEWIHLSHDFRYRVLWWLRLSNHCSCGWHNQITPISIKLLQWEACLPPLCQGRRLEEGRAGGPTCQERSRNLLPSVERSGVMQTSCGKRTSGCVC